MSVYLRHQQGRGSAIKPKVGYLLIMKCILLHLSKPATFEADPKVLSVYMGS